MTTTLRSRAALLTFALTATLAPAVGLAPPAAAAPVGCQDETHTVVLLSRTGCDDTTPPDTRITSITPTRNAAGWVGASTVTIGFAADLGNTGDAGAIGFQCRSTRQATYQDCASPVVVEAIPEHTGGTPFFFEVRAVDTADAAIQACDATPALACGSKPDAPDWDGSPARTDLKVDTEAPNTFVGGVPFEELRPDWPVALTDRPRLVLDTNDAAAGFRCTLNGAPRPCGRGALTLARLRAGDQRLTVVAVDPAGNADPSPESVRFFVPRDLTLDRAARLSGFRAVRRAGHFGAGYLQARRTGAELRLRTAPVREVRLVGPSGPRLGRIQVKIADSRWYTVDLRGPAAKARTYVVRDQYSPLRGGLVRIRVVGVPRGGSVRLDAVVLRK
ncbi:hypothetical protein [Nocardioides sp. SYSU D00038]|uniref:hypothetical protein n=1 Tax=Nocardioides sp. SYSU D00038 TaxID=2812554 RepID=UPI00196795B4|nr:hypothetical protein [Nocardioides sp. SYSU D00038]